MATVHLRYSTVFHATMKSTCKARPARDLPSDLNDNRYPHLRMRSLLGLVSSFRRSRMSALAKMLSKTCLAAWNTSLSDSRNISRSGRLQLWRTLSYRSWLRYSRSLEPRQRRSGRDERKLIGRNEVEDAPQRLDALTQEEAWMAAAEALAITHGIDDKVKETGVAI
ncbi:hypothetical protein H4582DRAFT_128986 [Lactarius indigo]|nr:hypothetical protein H4582DRAFT_128986 [Lactarius indigo]